MNDSDIKTEEEFIQRCIDVQHKLVTLLSDEDIDICIVVMVRLLNTIVASSPDPNAEMKRLLGYIPIAYMSEIESEDNHEN